MQHLKLRCTVRDRFKNELGLDVDDAKHLRAVPRKIHHEITSMQNQWAVDKMKELGILKDGEVLNNKNRAAKFAELWKKVDLKEVVKFNEDLEKVYSKYLVKAGRGAKEFQKVAKLLERKPFVLFEAARGSRLKRLFPKIGGSVALLAMLSENLAFAKNLAGEHNEVQEDAWKTFESVYVGALQTIQNGGRLDYDTAHKLRKYWIEYLKTLEAPDKEVQKLDLSMGAWIDANLPGH